MWSWAAGMTAKSAPSQNASTDTSTPAQAFLHHDLAACFPEPSFHQHGADSRSRLATGLGDHHALAPRQPARLDDGYRGKPLEVIQGRSGLGEGSRGAGRYRQRVEERLAIGLGGLEPGAGHARSEGRNADRLQRIRQTCGQRRLGTHRHQIDRLALGETHQAGHVAGADRHVLAAFLPAGAGVAGRHQDPFHPGGTGQGTAHRMLAAATAHHEHRGHELTLPTRRRTDPCGRTATGRSALAGTGTGR